MQAVRVRVEGYVQGVGFRAFVRGHAQRLGLAGWVRNLPDGSVEAFAQGDPELVERFLEAVRRGPEGSWVRNLEHWHEDPQGEGRRFEVRW